MGNGPLCLAALPLALSLVRFGRHMCQLIASASVA
jgi:hypothetical protein